MVHEEHEVLGRAVAARGREVAEGLVAPGAVERVLHERQELDVGEAHLLDVVGEERRRFAVGEEPVPLLRDPTPRSEMDFVDRDRRLEAVRVLPRRHPVPVAPFVVQVPDDGRGPRRDLPEEGVGVALLRGAAADLRGDEVLVHRAFFEAGDETFPDARAVPSRSEGVAARLPAVEIADDRNALGVRRPDGEQACPPGRRRSWAWAPSLSKRRKWLPSLNRYVSCSVRSVGPEDDLSGAHLTAVSAAPVSSRRR